MIVLKEEIGNIRTSRKTNYSRKLDVGWSLDKKDVVKLTENRDKTDSKAKGNGEDQTPPQLNEEGL